MILPFFSSRGVLGLNARNLLYIKPFNPRKAIAFADDKLKTKAYLAARGIPVARIYARIESRRQLRSFDFSTLPDQCVLKPKYGFGGGGIKVLKGRKDGVFLEQGKIPVTYRDLTEHIEDILDGKYSINGMHDTAFFEKILEADPAFAPLRPAGLPDIRIVVFNLVPVMAMLRIPTAASGGKANVHLGGIGIGIDLATGRTTFATQYNKRIHVLPHGGSPSGIQIPHWEELLRIASRIQELTNIGYLAVDLTLDREQGPVLLEVNARAGLMVQVANLAPLRARLERVSGVRVQSVEKGVRLAQDLFGAKRPARATDTAPDRPVLGTRELLSISGTGATVDVPALLSPDHERTVFAPDLLAELIRAGAAEVESETDRTFRVKFTLGGRRMQTIVQEGEVEPPSVRALVGRRDLKGFLIDPDKAAAFTILRPAVREDLRAIDKTLAQIDHDLVLLPHVKPSNLLQEREKLLVDPAYNPFFTYDPPRLPLDDIEARLLNLSIEDSPMGTLFQKKRHELLLRIALIRARGSARAFTEASVALFGRPTTTLLTAAAADLRRHASASAKTDPNDTLTAEEAAALFREALDRYALDNWKVSVREETVARVTVGGSSVVLRGSATFAKASLRGLIAHEIETHVLTAENGAHQPFELFRRGCAHYLDTQEGLAIFNQNRFLPAGHEKRVGPARNMLGAAYALEHSFVETRRSLEEDLGYEPSKALSKAMELKRGLGDTAEPGGFTKGIVYERGLRAIEQYLAQGGDILRLYMGKIALEDLPLLEQVPDLKPPVLLPEFLRMTKSP